MSGLKIHLSFSRETIEVEVDDNTTGFIQNSRGQKAYYTAIITEATFTVKIVFPSVWRKDPFFKCFTTYASDPKVATISGGFVMFGHYSSEEEARRGLQLPDLVQDVTRERQYYDYKFVSIDRLTSC